MIPQEPKLAFEDVDATELYPCVMFYSSNPGEKVREQKCPQVWKTKYVLSLCTQKHEELVYELLVNLPALVLGIMESS